MSRKAVNGAVIAIASTFGASKTFTGVTNASPGVASFAADPALIAGDIFEILTSGWGRLEGRMARCVSPSGAGPYLVGLEGINTTDTSKYPASEGGGTCREVTAWQTIGQILGEGFAPGGGEQQFIQWQYIDQDVQSQAPTSQTPPTLGFVLHDDIASLGQIAIDSAMELGTPVPFRLAFRDGSKSYGTAYWSLQRVPQLASNDFAKRSVTLSFVGGRLTEYAT